ncbi:putative inorganic phosphate cotransporter [Bicyclus anynana]|uniref:Inorganic phosphate cotransporter n=1 Tax=Bicyclus anynana TaxID=110368 RepID=A0ABM3LR33_BICAN|nr:putative inorganic phosphate cotransporter [Bicyclus anynana]
MDVEFIRHKFEDSYDGVLTKTKFKVGVRHLQMIYMFVCSLVLGMLRGSNGIGVLAIADFTRKNDSYVQIHNWDMRIQGTVLSSYLFGYALILVPAELYLKQVVDKLILTAVLLINGGLAAAMPTIVNKGGWIAVCNAQFLLGMTQACLTPVNQKLITNWLPPSERQFFGFVIQGAILLGTIISLPISGLLTQSRLSWELVFYSQAMMTLSMAVIWALLTASSPEQHQAIGDTEKEFIRDTLAGYYKKKLQKPWRRILQTKQFWALSLAHCAANVLFVFFLFEIPAFLHSLRLSVTRCSWQAALPLATMWMVYVTTAPAVDLFYRFGHINFLFDVKYFRKIINGLGTFGIIIGLTILPNLVSNWNHLGVIVLIGTLALVGLQFSGFLENHKDMTQNYPGTLLLLTSAVASLVAAVVPLLSGLVIGEDVCNIRRWRIVFSALAALYLVCNVVYSVCASSERQPWDGTLGHKFGYSNVFSALAALYLVCNVVYSVCASSERQPWDGTLGHKFGYSNVFSALAALYLVCNVVYSVCASSERQPWDGTLGHKFEYSNVFSALAALYLVCNVVYSVCASSERQPWDGTLGHKFGYSNVFLALAALYLVCNVVYSVCASSERQPWDGTLGHKFGYSNVFSALAALYLVCNVVYSVCASSERQPWDGTLGHKFGYSNVFSALAALYLVCNVVYSVCASSERQPWDGTLGHKFGYSNVFSALAALYLVCNVVYSVCASSERQPWDGTLGHKFGYSNGIYHCSVVSVAGG